MLQVYGDKITSFPTNEVLETEKRIDKESYRLSEIMAI
jgi:hypothetical protein